MRDYFLQHLGVGEIWKLRTPVQAAPAFATEPAPLVGATSRSYTCDLVLICRDPESADAAFAQDLARLNAHVLGALNFNQTLNIQTVIATEESVAQLRSIVLNARPRAVLIFGAAYACGLLSLDSATVSGNLRQGNHCLEDIPVIVTHELVTLLHQAALKRELWLDLCRVKDLFAH